jgi:ribosomal protein S18 acetylase RimI-like enzyme
MILPVELTLAQSPDDCACARLLFAEYANGLGIDLGFQDFAFELDHLAEVYAAPAGCVVLARSGGAVVGCVGVRGVSAELCEMKRLYVREEARGQGLGRRLAVASIAAARERGYRRMVLDTLKSLTAARTLYASLGFRETAPYYANPLPDVVYMELDFGTLDRSA